MAYEFILYEKEDGIARVTLNRPEKLNALSVGLQEELIDALKEAERDEDVRVIVLKGAGRAFSSGYDITPTPEGEAYGEAPIRQDIQQLQQTAARWSTVWNLSKPVIAQIHGYCLAGGTDLALHCDIVAAAEDTQIGFPAVRAMGSPPTHMWTYLVGPQWAKRMLLTGDSIDGKTAERIGLIYKAVPPEELEGEVNRLAEKMARISSDLLAANKGIVNKALELMGRGMLQQLAAENDGIAHRAPVVQEFNRIAREQGLRAALDWRDGPFADNRASQRRPSPGPPS